MHMLPTAPHMLLNCIDASGTRVSWQKGLFVGWEVQGGRKVRVERVGLSGKCSCQNPCCVFQPALPDFSTHIRYIAGMSLRRPTGSQKALLWFSR